MARTGMALARVPFVATPGSKLSRSTTPVPSRPVCDEWGVYDPEQAGFEAIIRRLLPDEDDPNRGQAPTLPRHVAESTR